MMMNKEKWRNRGGRNDTVNETRHTVKLEMTSCLILNTKKLSLIFSKLAHKICGIDNLICD